MKVNLSRYTKISIFFTAVLFFPFVAFAQNAKLSVLKDFSLKDAFINQGVIQVGDFFYRAELDESSKSKYTSNLKKIKFGVNICKYDMDMKEVRKLSLGIGNDDKLGPYYPKLLLFNDKLLFFYFKVQQDKQVKLFMMNINIEPMEDDRTIELCTIPENIAFNSSASSIQLRFCISPDNSKLLLVRFDDYSEIFTCVFDRALSIVRKHSSGLNKLVQFTIGNIFVDNNANEYIAYRYNDTRSSHKYGLLMESEKGDAFWETFNGPPIKTYITDVGFASGAGGSKVYIYANYHAGTEVGVKLAIADGANLVTTDEQVLLYPEDLKEKIYQEGFGEKHKGVYSTNDVTYTLTEIGNGTIVLTGYPEGVHLRAADKNIHIYERKVGSIINIFIKNNTPIFKTIKTKQTKLLGGGVIAFEAKGNLVCIYNASRETLTPAGNEASGKDDDDIVLGEYVANSDGVEISRQQIAEQPGRKNYYFIIDNKLLPGHRFIMPVGYERGAWSAFAVEIVQWVTLELQ